MKKMLTRLLSLLLAVMMMIPAVTVNAKEYIGTAEDDEFAYEFIWQYIHRYDDNEEIMTAVNDIKAKTTELTLGIPIEYNVTKDTIREEQWYKVTVPDDCQQIILTFTAVDKEFDYMGKPLGGWGVRVRAENLIPNAVYRDLLYTKKTYKGIVYDNNEPMDYRYVETFGFYRTLVKDCDLYKDDKTATLKINRSDWGYTDDTWYINIYPYGIWVDGTSFVDVGSCYSILATEGEKRVDTPSDEDDNKSNDNDTETDDEPSEKPATDKNNSYKTATTIRADKPVTESLASTSDTTDWFKFTVPTGTAKLAFNAPSVTGNGWMLRLYKNPSAKPLKAVTANKNTDIKTSLKKGTYYAKVTASKKSKAIGKKYTLKLTTVATPSKVQLTQAKTGKKSVTLRWTKSKTASGYYIYRSTKKNGTYKKIATVKKAATTKYTDKKSLKSRRTYYYKVVAYKTAKGLTAKTSASNVKGVHYKND